MSTEPMLKKNVGGVDRIARIAVGGALVFAALVGGPKWLLIGFIPLFTGLMSTCPLYNFIGVNTCKNG